MIPYINYTDNELAALLREGDHRAFTEIYKRYWKKIYIIASKRLGDENEAEEIVQDIFLNLWRKHADFRLTTGFNNYFAVAVKFEILDVMRKRITASAYDKELLATYAEADLSTLRQLDMQELQQKLQLTVNGLPEKCQLVFRLKHEQGYSQKQIAEKLNISEKTVEAHLSRAKKTMRTAFGSLFSIILFIYL
ncbi:RNA polymerase sigma factor [Mucilaginibacter paludis]|uniref:RNA polymerase, sigma-24 subunit, ECF subfamily n=1 Tax=Mucilaginibacter paludis DSM 18603 TaxID=714943 RepID=H1YA55_9SPHI|nr:RNA polymerase sigma-70 factor [Mucilaginibacter paludis]EHQ25936.1 RNA polymerase, sigma-24 subunit, ECF subfamily [Mucilaginibacter paludis DSM 18603]